MPSRTFERVRSLTARMVPSMNAVSGMTLLVVPAVMRPTVTTDGSNTSMVRVTMVCSAWTISHAMGMGSSAACGWLAWPPRPVMVMCMVSADAMTEPPLLAIQPLGRLALMCSA